MSIATTSVQIGRRPSPVSMTDAAAAQGAELLVGEESADSRAPRVAVRPGGCSGYNYDMFFDSEIADDDIVRSFGDVTVVVDPESADLITGATLDYTDGLQAPAFHISTPNASRTCGCGSSFS